MHIDLYGDTLSALVTAGSLASTGHNVVLRMPQGRVRQQIIANKAAYSEPRPATADQQRTYQWSARVR
ncbi:hypothetical protein UMZ34_18815 [Halopseudomonas pachastrellae]|nr:hypothetical protein UMZ34_18815 [Halopseudomonas pachastrellae]